MMGTMTTKKTARAMKVRTGGLTDTSQSTGVTEKAKLCGTGQPIGRENEEIGRNIPVAPTALRGSRLSRVDRMGPALTDRDPVLGYRPGRLFQSYRSPADRSSGSLELGRQLKCWSAWSGSKGGWINCWNKLSSSGNVSRQALPSNAG